MRGDYYYRDAVMAIDKAIEKVFPYRSNRSFPDKFFSSQNEVFYSEGIIYWGPEDRYIERYLSSGQLRYIVNRTLYRCVEWTDVRDHKRGQVRLDSGTREHIFKHKTEETFKFHNDYTVFSRAFSSLKSDLTFQHQRCLESYDRRFSEFKTKYKVYDYTPQELNDTRNSSKKYFIRSLKDIEEQEKIALTSIKASLDYCLKYHDRPKAHFERGIFCFLEGHALDALEHVYKAINLGKDLDSLGEDAALLKAQMESELGLYAEAVESLTNLIQKDPTNKMAYYERASAYFEVGDFDLALTDYLSSEFKPINPSEMVGDTALFALGMLTGAVKGGAEAADEFIPSMLSTMYGLGGALWTSVAHPIDHTVQAIQVSKDLAMAAYSCAEYLAETPISQMKEAIGDSIASELQKLIENWKDLSIQERGDQTGFLLGKFGVNIFAADKTVKGVKLLSDLTKANRLLTFEAATLTEQNRLVILAKANEAAAKRTEALTIKSLKIKPDLQGKHIEGRWNFDEKRSIFEHSNPQELVIKHAGTGLGEKGVIGEANYVELVDFGEFIGYDVHPQTRVKTPTTWGKIHYAKDGTHIVPTMSRDLPSLNKQKVVKDLVLTDTESCILKKSEDKIDLYNKLDSNN